MADKEEGKELVDERTEAEIVDRFGLVGLPGKDEKFFEDYLVPEDKIRPLLNFFHPLIPEAFSKYEIKQAKAGKCGRHKRIVVENINGVSGARLSHLRTYVNTVCDMRGIQDHIDHPAFQEKYGKATKDSQRKQAARMLDRGGCRVHQPLQKYLNASNTWGCYINPSWTPADEEPKPSTPACEFKPSPWIVP